MSTDVFELIVSLPQDARFAGAAGALAVQAAQVAGCGEAEARAFGRTVEDAVRGCFEQSPSGSNIPPIIVRRNFGPVEVVVNDRTLRIGV